MLSRRFRLTYATLEWLIDDWHLGDIWEFHPTGNKWSSEDIRSGSLSLSAKPKSTEVGRISASQQSTTTLGAHELGHERVVVFPYRHANEKQSDRWRNGGANRPQDSEGVCDWRPFSCRGLMRLRSLVRTCLAALLFLLIYYSGRLLWSGDEHLQDNFNSTAITGALHSLVSPKSSCLS